MVVDAQQPTWDEFMKAKEALLDYLQQEAYVKLAPSLIEGAGVGVFAVRTIPADIDPFTSPNLHSKPAEMFIPLQLADLARAPPSVVAQSSL